MFPKTIDRLAVYRRLFSISEIESQPILQLVFGATVFSYFLTFYAWIGSSTITLDAVARGTYVCKPYFQECAQWYFLRALPNGYSQSTLYMLLFGSLLMVAYFMYRKEWVKAHLALLPAFIWHVLVVFMLTDLNIGNYDYYLAIFALIILFIPHKEFFLKLGLVLFYFLYTSAKIHETWILGSYFSALKTGLPLFPDWAIPVWTNLVIFMEMVAAWFLLSRNETLQRSVLAFFVGFHLYSGILVEYRYPATVLPTLFILFGPLYRHTPVPLDRKAVAGWSLVTLLFFAQMAPLMIQGDEKLTLEGNSYGLYMFEANHQCISTVRYIYVDGEVQERRGESISSRNRCDPYHAWFRIRTRCRANDMAISRAEWTFDHSINGGPFLRIVDVADACALSYNPFGRNPWIRTEKDNPPVIGYPVENVYD